MQRRRIENTEKDIDYFAGNKIDYKTMEDEETAKIRSDIFKAVGVHVNAPFEKKVLGYLSFEIDKRRFSIRLTVPYTEERKALARAKMIEINSKEESV